MTTSDARTAALERWEWRTDLAQRLNEDAQVTLGFLGDVLNDGDRLASLLREADAFLATVCDQPEDRMYHAADRTWWRREGLEWKAADPPNSSNSSNSSTAPASAEDEALLAEVAALWTDGLPQRLAARLREVLAERNTAPAPVSAETSEKAAPISDEDEALLTRAQRWNDTADYGITDIRCSLIRDLSARLREVLAENVWLAERAAHTTDAERREQARLINERDAAREELEQVGADLVLTEMRLTAARADAVRERQRADINLDKARTLQQKWCDESNRVIALEDDVARMQNEVFNRDRLIEKMGAEIHGLLEFYEERQREDAATPPHEAGGENP